MSEPSTSQTGMRTKTTDAWLAPRPSLNGKSYMELLFNRLDGAYPLRWRSAFPDSCSVQNWRTEWARAFSEERITPHMLNEGLRSCRKLYDWPPSITEFLRACRPPLDFEATFVEAVNQLRLRAEGKDSWSHRAIYWAAQYVGPHDMRMQPYSSLKGRWKRALEAEMAKAAWPEIPERRAALPAPGQTLVTRDTVRSTLSEILDMFKKPQRPGDENL